MRGLKQYIQPVPSLTELSHLLQMRGLKLWYIAMTRQELEVASFTDAWIETDKTVEFRKELASHLLQMRGLKPIEAQQRER